VTFDLRARPAPWCAGILLLGAFFACQDPSPKNRAPTILTTPPPAATTYQPYTYEAACADPDGDLVTLGLGPGDTCGGAIQDHGNRQATYSFTPGADVSSCMLSVRCSDSEGSEALQEVALEVLPARDVTDLVFETLALWDEPLADYHAQATAALGHRNFLHGIHDLALWQDRLYLGYGDANINIGRLVPINVRAYTRPEPGAFADELVTDEEQISHFRVSGDRLVVPGVDATEDGLLGNVYTLDATGWTKRRSLQWAWHVHDVAHLDGALYAVGSGGSMEDYNQSTVRAFLWQSVGDEPFSVFSSLEHPAPPGDHRLTNLLVVDGTLHAFGYYSSEGVSYGLRYRLVSGALEPWSELEDFFVFSTQSLGEAAGLVIGVNIGSSLTWGARLVTQGGASQIPALGGMTVLDAFPLPEGRALLLATAGDAYPTPPAGPHEITVWVLGPDAALHLVLQETLEDLPLSAAFWQRSVYVGMEDGRLLRSDGVL
jgi:hypothetical protein